MTIQNKTVLITGANRGVGRALVNEARQAAALNMTQSLRALLADDGVTVRGVLPGPTDTAMAPGFDISKASPEAVAQGIFDGLRNKERDIFPDPLSQSIAEGWRTGIAKAFERRYTGFVPDKVAL